MLVARVGLVEDLHDIRVEVAQVGDLGLVERLQQAALDLRLGEHRTRHHDVVAGVAGHQLGMQRLVGLEGVVVDLDAGFLLEGSHHALGDVVRPVVDVEDLFLGSDRGGRRSLRDRLLLLATSRQGSDRNGRQQQNTFLHHFSCFR